MTFIKKLCRDRRGMAMEMAMMVMVVTFALGALMVTVALMQNDAALSISKDTRQKIELEQIGENFYAHVAKKNTGEGFTYNSQDEPQVYDVQVNGNTLTVTKKGGGTVLLTVEVKATTQEGVATTYEIAKWEIN